MRIKTHSLLKLPNFYVVYSRSPSNIKYLLDFGILLAVCLILYKVVEITLAMYYAPSLPSSYNSKLVCTTICLLIYMFIIWWNNLFCITKTLVNSMIFRSIIAIFNLIFYIISLPFLSYILAIVISFYIGSKFYMSKKKLIFFSKILFIISFWYIIYIFLEVYLFEFNIEFFFALFLYNYANESSPDDSLFKFNAYDTIKNLLKILGEFGLEFSSTGGGPNHFPDYSVVGLLNQDDLEESDDSETKYRIRKIPEVVDFGYYHTYPHTNNPNNWSEVKLSMDTLQWKYFNKWSASDVNKFIKYNNSKAKPLNLSKYPEEKVNSLFNNINRTNREYNIYSIILEGEYFNSVKDITVTSFLVKKHVSIYEHCALLNFYLKANTWLEHNQYNKNLNNVAENSKFYFDAFWNKQIRLSTPAIDNLLSKSHDRSYINNILDLKVLHKELLENIVYIALLLVENAWIKNYVHTNYALDSLANYDSTNKISFYNQMFEKLKVEVWEKYKNEYDTFKLMNISKRCLEKTEFEFMLNQSWDLRNQSCIKLDIDNINYDKYRFRGIFYSDNSDNDYNNLNKYTGNLKKLTYNLWDDHSIKNKIINKCIKYNNINYRAHNLHIDTNITLLKENNTVYKYKPTDNSKVKFLKKLPNKKVTFPKKIIFPKNTLNFFLHKKI